MDTARAVESPGLSRRAFGIIFAVSMTTAIGNTGMQSVLPAIGRQIGMPDPLVVSIFSLSAFLWAAMSPFWARQSDRRGRRPLILTGLAGYLVSMLACGAVVFAGLMHWAAPLIVFVLFLFARAIFGAIGSASNPASQAYVAERTSRIDRTQSMAGLAGAFGLGTIIGPAIAPFFVLPGVTLAGPMFAFAAMALVMLVIVQRFLPDSAPAASLSPEDGGRGTLGEELKLWRDPRLAPFLIYSFLIASCQTVQGQTLGFVIIDKLGVSPLVAQGFTAVAMMAGAIAGLLAQWGLIRMFRLNPKGLLRWGAGIAAIANVLAAFAPNYWTVVIAYAVANLGYAFARPGFTAGVSLSVAPHEQARAAGAIAAINGGNVIVAPLLGMLLYEQARWSPFVLNALVLGGMLYYAFSSGVLRNAGEEPTTDELAAAATLERSEEGVAV